MIEIRKISFTSFTLFFMVVSPLSFGITTEQNQLFTSKKAASTLFKHTTGNTQFQTHYIDLNSKANSGNLLSFKVKLDLEKKLTQSLKFKFEGGGRFEKGNSDSLFDNSFIDAQNELFFDRAEFVWAPTTNISLLAGAIRTIELEQPLLLSRGSFLGLKQMSTNRIGDLSIELSALQAIPNNKNYSNRLDEVDEGNPEFYMESAAFTYGNELNKAKYRLSHYAFDNLSNSVASDSRFTGNSAYVYDKDNAEFVYSYQGWTQNLSLQYANSFMVIKPFMQLMENTAAPAKNKAWLNGVSTTYIAGDKRYSFIVNQFRSEADSAVGFYQSKAFFLVNHQGQGLTFLYNDLSEGLMFKLVLGQMKEIEINQLEDKDEIHTAVLVLRKTYDLF